MARQPRQRERPVRTRANTPSERLVILNAELTVDPLDPKRGYAGMSDAEAADDLNTVYRSGAGDIVALREYMILTRSSSGEGGDTVPTQLLGRIRRLAAAGVNDDPYSAAVVVDQKNIDAATGLNSYAVPESTGAQVGVDFRTEPRFVEMLDDLVEARAITEADKENIQALSDNRQSRGSELGVGTVSEGDVAAARNI